MRELHRNPKEAAILAVASSVGMPASVGVDTLILFALALRASDPPIEVGTRWPEFSMVTAHNFITIRAETPEAASWITNAIEQAADGVEGQKR